MTITTVSSGQTVSGFTVLSGNEQDVLSSGTAVSTTVLGAGAAQIIFPGGSALAATISGAAEELIFSGGWAGGTTIKSGLQIIEAYGTASGTVINGGYQIVDGTASDTVVNAGGAQTVVGTATSTVINNDGFEYVYGTANGMVVNSGGTVDVSYGTASDIVINSGGLANIYGFTASATVFNPTIAGGALVNYNGTISGTITFSGSGGLLALATTSLPTAVISGFAPGDKIDLRAISFDSGGMVVLQSGNVLQFRENGVTYNLQLDSTDYSSAGFVLSNDGSGGTAITVDNTGPNEPQSVLPVAVGGTATVSRDFLWSSDPDNSAAQLTYTLTALPAHGTVLLNGAAATSFTQADIDNGLVQYRENGDVASGDSFRFTVSDPAGNLIGPEPFRIAIVSSTAPVIEGNAAVAVSTGGSALLSTFSLDTVALGSTPQQMVYRVLEAPTHGLLLVNGAPGGTFTQADIDDHRVRYSHNGDAATRDAFMFEVTNAAGDRTAPTAFGIAIETVGQVACFRRSTRILTDKGEVPVEDLAIGDRVVTLTGLTRPIKWIGRRAYDPRFAAGNAAILPIRIAAGAVARGVPARDLWVSPEHALYVDGMLAPARLLVNDTTIVQVERVDALEYFHVELATHDVIFAAGAAVESYVECDNRGMFHNAAEFARLYPGEGRPGGMFCAPRLALGSPELAGIRATITGRWEARAA